MTVLFVLRQNQLQEGQLPPSDSQFKTADTLATGRPHAHVELSLLNLFGQTETTASGANREAINAPTTRLNLELLGIFMSDDRKETAAIVAEKNKEGELFYLGDTLPGNAELYEVLDDHVLIRRNGNIEKLMFEAYSSGAFMMAPAQSAHQESDPSPRPGTSRTPIQRLPQADIGTVNTDADQVDQKESILASYRRRFEQDPTSVLNEFGISPVAKNSASGYKIQSEASTPLLNRSGLKEGDIILSVNGQPVGQSSSDLALFDGAQEARRLRIEVQRGSRKFFITVPVN